MFIVQIIKKKIQLKYDSHNNLIKRALIPRPVFPSEEGDAADYICYFGSIPSKGLWCQS